MERVYALAVDNKVGRHLPEVMQLVHMYITASNQWLYVSSHHLCSVNNLQIRVFSRHSVGQYVLAHAILRLVSL